MRTHALKLEPSSSRVYFRGGGRAALLFEQNRFDLQLLRFLFTYPRFIVV